MTDLIHTLRTALPNPILKSPVAGVDISLWEPDFAITWSKMPEAIKFVIIKATELDWEDPEVAKHCLRLALLSYLRSLYHFLHEDDILKQAKKFIEVAKKVGAIINNQWRFEIPPVLDVEVKALVRGVHFQDQVLTWLNLVEDACGVRPIIYTSQNFWNNYVCSLINNKIVPPTWTSNYKLWVAQYPYYFWVNSANNPGKLPAGWTDYIAWQYYDAYKFDAIKYNGCDVNVMKPEYFEGLSTSTTSRLAAYFDKPVYYKETQNA